MHKLHLLPTACLFLLSTVTSPAQAQCGAPSPHEIARGTVFIDSNGDGQRSNTEAGLAGVAVSNGCDVVLTDADGGYQLDLAATEILFISKPADYSLPVDEHNIPQFFYRHYPEGTPGQIAGTAVEWLFPVVAPTGPLPDSIDFPLRPRPDSDANTDTDTSTDTTFRAHGFADTQARFELSQDMLREDLINPLIGNPHDVEFGLTVGDVVYDNLALYDRHKAMMGLMGIPQWYLPGNHDVNFESPNGYFANETYKLHFGPTYYSFNHGNVHFVALNNVDYAGAGKEFSGGRYRGYLTADQLHWLEQDLAQVATDKLIVIATHIPLVAEAEDGRSPAATGPDTENFSALLALLAPFDNIYALAGHDTSNSWKVEVGHSHGWSGQPWIAHTLAEVRGSGWNRGTVDPRGVRDAIMEDGNPNGYYVLHFDNLKLTPEFIPFPFGPDAAQRLRISLDPPPANGEPAINRGTLAADTVLVVNLFDGGVRDIVWASIDNGPRVEMIYTVRTDPTVERLQRTYEGTDSAYSNARRSSHIWEMPLPAGLEPGLHQVVITSLDEFGQRQRGNFAFEVLPD